MVTTLSRFTGRNSTVPPKSIPNVTSLEPLICPWEALLLQNCHILPKRNISLAGPQHPPKAKYFLNTDTTELQGGRYDGDPHTTRYDPQDGLECRGQASCMGLLEGEAGAVLRDCWHSQGARVTHILFYGGKEASERWTALKDQVEGNKDDADTVFKAFANSFEKSSSHWQARDEYLSDIKQDKNQTTAELDIYIKDLIRRCQFPPEDQESRKIDLLYHATAHFEVRKFVHNAKQEELKYDRMIEVAKAHKRTCQEYQIHKQAHSMANPSNSYANPLIQTNALLKSFQKGPAKKTCGKRGRSHSHGDCPAYGTTCSKCGRPNHWAQQCRSSGRRNSSTGHSPSPGRPQNR